MKSSPPPYLRDFFGWKQPTSWWLVQISGEKTSWGLENLSLFRGLSLRWCRIWKHQILSLQKKRDFWMWPTYPIFFLAERRGTRDLGMIGGWLGLPNLQCVLFQDNLIFIQNKYLGMLRFNHWTLDRFHNLRKRFQKYSQMLHVWNIYLHLSYIYSKCM